MPKALDSMTDDELFEELFDGEAISDVIDRLDAEHARAENSERFLRNLEENQ